MSDTKNALVTGSTSGIGLGIAEAFAAAGMNLALNGLGDAGEIEAIREDIARRHGVKVIYSGADMARPEQIEAMMALARDELGEIDVLVNNAGI